MSRKKHKKRDKPYTGSDSVDVTPHVTRYKAVARSPLGEWWHTNKKRVRIFATVAGGAIIFVYLIFELLRLIF